MIMEETIAAIATAYGEGGIGIIRISGPESSRILGKIFNGRIEDHKLCYGTISDGKEIIDEVLAVCMKSPRSYTAEDVVEINCHGSTVSLRRILALVLRNGARLAEPGEFTKRAFLNGRLDLSQAEAVIDIIKAKSDKSFDVAVSQLEGSLSCKVNEIRKEILDVLVDVTVNIDYPDEDIEILTYEKMKGCLCISLEKIKKLLSTAHAGRLIREGIKIAIAGKPNVGKSSLMNCLLRQSRAIVTEIPGTTRDTIEENANVRGIPVYLIDTAGIHETDDKVEKIGIEKSKEAFNSADYVIFVVDGSQELTREDMEIMEHLQGRKSLILINKRDKGSAVDAETIRNLMNYGEQLSETVNDLQSDRKKHCDISGEINDWHIIETSLIDGDGIDEIEDHIESLVYGGEISQEESVMVNNVRHMELLSKAENSIEDALAMIELSEALDIIEIDIRNAFDYLGEIIGETVSDEILDEVFSRFCLGK